MLETKITLIEDRPDLIVIKESPRPWQWGGLHVNAGQILMILVYFYRLVVNGSNKVTVERAYQTVTLNSRVLLSRKKETVQFANIESISLSPRKMTRTGDSANPTLATLSIDLGDLSLTLADKSSVRIGTGYWSDKEIRVIGGKIAEFLGKPFAIHEKGN